MLRTSIIVGRPDLGMPDYRHLKLGKALTDQDITDLVAFLASKRPVNSAVAQSGDVHEYIVTKPYQTHSGNKSTGGSSQQGKMIGTHQEESVAEQASKKHTRRDWLFVGGVVLNVAAGLLFAVPLVGFVFSSFVERKDPRSWISLGATENFPEHATRIATYRNPFTRPWDGQTAGHSMLGATHARPHVSGLRHQLYASWLSGPVGFRNRACSLPVPRRRLL